MDRHEMALCDVPSGTKARVVCVRGDNGLRSRLCAMGITPGTEIEVSDECGCMQSRRIKVRESSLVVGFPASQNVVCECPYEENNQAGEGFAAACRGMLSMFSPHRGKRRKPGGQEACGRGRGRNRFSPPRRCGEKGE